MPAAGGEAAPYLRGVAEFEWSHHGTQLVYHTTAPGDPLFVRGEGRTDRRIYGGPAGVHCHFPVWSTNDDYIYFIRGVPPDDWDLWRIRPERHATGASDAPALPAVLPGRARSPHDLAYLATDADGSGPWMYVIDPEGGPAHRITSGLENFTSLAASADGRKLVATISTPRDSLWRLSPPGTRRPATAIAPVKLVTNAATPRLSGSTLVYTSASGDVEGIWVKRGDSAHEIWRSKRAHVLSAPAISDDGQHIAFSTSEDGKTALNVVDLDGAHFRRIADSLLLRGSAAWSADGLSVLSAVVRDGEPRLTRIFLNGEPPTPFVAEYSIDPVWSPDHRFVVYSGADIGTTFPLRAAAPDGRPHPIAGVMLTRGARRVAFYPASESLVILDGEIGHKNFWLLDLASGAKRLLARLPADEDVRDFDVSPADAEIVFDRIEASSEMAVIDRTPQ